MIFETLRSCSSIELFNSRLVWKEPCFSGAGLFQMDAEVELWAFSPVRQLQKSDEYVGVIFQQVINPNCQAWSYCIQFFCSTEMLYFDHFFWKHHNLFPERMLIMLHPPG